MIASQVFVGRSARTSSGVESTNPRQHDACQRDCARNSCGLTRPSPPTATARPPVAHQGLVHEQGHLARRIYDRVVETRAQVSWLLHVVRPAWSYRLNADFEDHAEHEYATLVSEHAEWETTPFSSSFAPDYGQFESLADFFRQVSHDERLHKLESERNITSAHFASSATRHTS
jgi:hypothetical protein